MVRLKYLNCCYKNNFKTPFVLHFTLIFATESESCPLYVSWWPLHDWKLYHSSGKQSFSSSLCALSICVLGYKAQLGCINGCAIITIFNCRGRTPLPRLLVAMLLDMSPRHFHSSYKWTHSLRGWICNLCSRYCWVLVIFPLTCDFSRH
jgi:hypothetical protein